MSDFKQHIGDGRKRVIIENVSPQIDCGRFPIKRVIGEKVRVEADIFCDGHDRISCLLLYKKEGQEENWTESVMQPLVNDRWTGSFEVTEMGYYFYTIQAWIDHFQSWRVDLRKKFQAGQDVSVDLLFGSQMIRETLPRVSKQESDRLLKFAEFIESDTEPTRRFQVAEDQELADLMLKYADRSLCARLDQELPVLVERRKARFSNWYELFPRSAASGTRHGTFKDCQAWLPYIAEMGFDILYFPPIHPIGITNRKGKNNATVATPEDCGSPWAIGGREGGHKSIHPDLGTLEDFRDLIAEATKHGIEVALDLAYQCSPDHPYVKEHREWYRKRPDGTIQYAENPPKKYEDIYPFHFETECWKDLWHELKSVIDFWIEQGVHIFRVDNPHTKPFPFWEWAIGDVKKNHPEAIFLSEAFTRPKVMYRLAKLGFSQSYTYFAWRNTKWELTEYFTELTQTEVAEYFRPNAWPNTPDILTEFLQTGGRPAFMSRLILAATLSANYGIYGPAFELCVNRAKERGSEEYLNSEKYEIKAWKIDQEDSLRDLIARVNRIRKENRALQSNHTLRFHDIDNEQLICYSKRSEEDGNVILTVVNLDPYHTHSGWLDLPLEELGIPTDQGYQVHDLLSEARYVWNGPRNYVELNPQAMPAHVFRVRRRIRTEQDFEYFM